MTAFPRDGIYASLRGNVQGDVLTRRLDALSKWSDVVIELGTLELHPEHKAKLKRTSRIHAYVVMSWWQSGIPFFREFAQIVEDTDGIMVNDTGQFWAWSNVNLARTATMEAIADLIVRYSVGWDAIFIDILVTALHGQTDVGWKVMGYSSYQEFETLWNANAPEFVRRIQRGSGLPVTTNYGNSFPGISNGNMREAFPRQYGGSWESNMVGTERNPGQLNIAFPAPRNAWLCSEFASYDPRDPENQRIALFHDASACLSGDFGSFGRYEWDDNWCEARGLFYPMHYTHPQRGKGWLGEPITVAQHVTEQRGKVVDLWVRGFEDGLAIVNPSSQKHSIYLPSRFRPIGGVAKNAFNLPPKTGLLLEAV